MSAMSLPQSRPLRCVALCLCECMKALPKRKGRISNAAGAPQVVSDLAFDMTNQPMYIALSSSQLSYLAAYVNWHIMCA